MRLIERGELPAHVPGEVRRRLFLNDVLNYRESLRTRRDRFVAESSAEYRESVDEEMPTLLAEARRRR